MAKGNSKPQVYQGKTYPSISALAKELNISALYLGQGIKKYPDDIEKAIEHCKAKMNGTGNTRNKKVVYKGVEYKSYSDLARNLLHMRSVDRFNAKRYELMKKEGRTEEEAITEAIEYFESINDTSKKDIEKPNSLDHVERNVIIANTAKIIVDEIQSYLQKNKLSDHAKIYGHLYTTDFKKITNQEKYLLYVAKVAVNELLRINEELNENYLASIFVDTLPWDNTMQWSCIIAHKDKLNIYDEYEKIEKIHENDFNDTQREWLGGDRIRRDARKVNKARGDVKND